MNIWQFKSTFAKILMLLFPRTVFQKVFGILVVAFIIDDVFQLFFGICFDVFNSDLCLWGRCGGPGFGGDIHALPSGDETGKSVRAFQFLRCQRPRGQRAWLLRAPEQSWFPSDLSTQPVAKRPCCHPDFRSIHLRPGYQAQRADLVAYPAQVAVPFRDRCHRPRPDQIQTCVRDCGNN